MALWVCGGEDGCGTKYAVGLSRCPRCHNTEFYEDGDPMAKITRHGGASDVTAPAPEAEAAPELLVGEPDPELFEPEASDVAESTDGPADPLPEPVGDAEQDSIERTAAPDYEAWTVEQLKDQLDSRGLPKTGKKDDLVLRLLEDDDARASDPGAE